MAVAPQVVAGDGEPAGDEGVDDVAVTAAVLGEPVGEEDRAEGGALRGADLVAQRGLAGAAEEEGGGGHQTSKIRPPRSAMPPSMRSIAPVMYDPAGETRKRIPSAISSMVA